ncbi:TetR family transcriptional regulator [Kibdelosporangium philippinense]|uniref:TetR family transcriptional regulator n=1 Tax=Kibdelosporangium philippinense TaxID=211113 RepID=A0ABS8ZWA8_9PSEU|nr:TetR family transcriptional regulator [Kibdelosporangium philippinense]MCE7012019.1 TetR family transcriptional regulator [Kibdelosporangium philippinense]
MAETLTTEQILEVAQDVLRRFGPSKATVVDVARALGVSHGSVYRHFPSKAALREAVTRQWLHRTHVPVAQAAKADLPAPDRLRHWLATLFDAKRHKVLDDPELFATFSALVRENSTVIADHVQELTGEIAGILRDGVEAGLFAPINDVNATARAVFDATNRFHDPAHSGDWDRDGIDKAFDAVCSLVLAGLTAQAGREVVQSH